MDFSFGGPRARPVTASSIEPCESVPVRDVFDSVPCVRGPVVYGHEISEPGGWPGIDHADRDCDRSDNGPVHAMVSVSLKDYLLGEVGGESVLPVAAAAAPRVPSSAQKGDLVRWESGLNPR